MIIIVYPYIEKLFNDNLIASAIIDGIHLEYYGDISEAKISSILNCWMTEEDCDCFFNTFKSFSPDTKNEELRTAESQLLATIASYCLEGNIKLNAIETLGRFKLLVQIFVLNKKIICEKLKKLKSILEKDNPGIIKGSIEETEIDSKNVGFKYKLNVAPNDKFLRIFDSGINKAEAGDFLGAISDFTRAIELDPESADSFRIRGSSKYSLGDYKGAIQDLNKAIESDPESAYSFEYRGYAKYFLKDYIGAVQDFSKAIELNPKYTEAYYFRGLAKFALNDKQGGCLDLSKASELGYEKAYDAIKEHCQ